MMAEPQKKDLRAELETQLLALLAGGQAHADFDKVIQDFPVTLRGERPKQVPYSGWQLLEHLRITQRDILDFCTNRDGAGYTELAWPKEYWPVESAPPSDGSWDDSVTAMQADREHLGDLLTAKGADLVAPFPWGDGQNLLREVLLVADHTAYHLGEMVLLRRLLGAWES